MVNFCRIRNGEDAGYTALRQTLSILAFPLAIRVCRPRQGRGERASAGSPGFLSYHTPVQDEARGQPRGDKVSWLFAVWPRGAPQVGRDVGLSHPLFSITSSCTGAFDNLYEDNPTSSSPSQKSSFE